MPDTLKRSRWVRWVVIVGLLWGTLEVIAAALSEPTPENIVYLISIPGSGLYTLLLYATRRLWLPRLAGHPLRNGMLLGIVNAAVIEALFLVVANSLGAPGIAAHPNLFIDWILTMPWYIGMVILFIGAHHRRRFSWATVLLLGAVYEAGADGVVGGQIAPHILGDAPDVGTWLVFLVLVAFWQFIQVYSSMVLPSAWVIETQPAPQPPPPTPAWRDALKPLWWLIPYTIYLIIILFVILFVVSTQP